MTVHFRDTDPRPLDPMDEADIEQDARDRQFDIYCRSCGALDAHAPLWNCQTPARHTAIPRPSA